MKSSTFPRNTVLYNRPVFKQQQQQQVYRPQTPAAVQQQQNPMGQNRPPLPVEQNGQEPASQTGQQSTSGQQPFVIRPAGIKFLKRQSNFQLPTHHKIKTARTLLHFVSC
jgi:hypothetical protein